MSTPISRRDFIRTTSTAASLTALASVYAPGAHAAGAEGEIKVGLVGCGGRGTGAASQALMATDTARWTSPRSDASTASTPSSR
jgi:myo-inositol 2-dehydrogenase / D-chiro-inositol 1-dehydrogenase